MLWSGRSLKKIRRGQLHCFERRAIRTVDKGPRRFLVLNSEGSMFCRDLFVKGSVRLCFFSNKDEIWDTAMIDGRSFLWRDHCHLYSIISFYVSGNEADMKRRKSSETEQFNPREQKWERIRSGPL